MSSTNFDKIYTAAEVGKELGLDQSMVEWLSAREFDPNDPILVIDYLPEFSFVGPNDNEQNKNALHAALIGNGAIQLFDDKKTYFFRTWPELYAARNAIRAQLPWAFYVSHGLAAARGLVEQFQTIRTKVITSIEVDSFQVVPFEFFEL